MPTLLYVLVAGLLAWWAGPALTNAVAFLPITEVASALTPRDIFSRDSAWYGALLFWTIVFYLVLRNTRFLTLLIAGPQSYGNARIVRWTIGALAEFGIMTVFAGPWIAGLMLSGVGPPIILDRLEAELGPAFVERAATPMRQRLGDMDRQLTTQSQAQTALKVEGFWERVKDVFRAPENQGEGVARTQIKTDNLQRAQRELMAGRTTLAEEIDAFMVAYSRGEREAVAQSRAAVWHEVTASRWRLVFYALRYLWLLALPGALLLYYLLATHLKITLGRLAVPVLNFVDEGRKGRGGSARFAGILDEWAVIQRRSA